MGLLERLGDELKESMRAGNHAKVSVIRLVKSSIKNKEIDKRSPLTEDEILDIIMSGIKQRRESVDQFRKGGREDLVQKETGEIEILQTYLPKPLTQHELENEIRLVIKEVGAMSPQDMGKVMRALMPRVRGRAEGTKVNSVVKEIMESLVH